LLVVVFRVQATVVVRGGLRRLQAHAHGMKFATILSKARAIWETAMTLITRRFLLGALPTIVVVTALPSWPALTATPGLTTHMLDTMNGIPAEGVRIDFAALDGDTYRLLATMRTNADGRTPQPLLNAETMKAGRYQLTFYVAEYFAKRGVALPDPPFVDRAVIQFGIVDPAAHYHVPLLASPWSYTTYRGS
jgi:5-hydroxyisourate hydrolase